MRTQSRDKVIQEAALQGIKLWKIAGGYYTSSAEAMAREASLSAAYIRRSCLIAYAGLADDVVSGELTHHKGV